jgi:Ca-activated chloride channel family protein
VDEQPLLLGSLPKDQNLSVVLKFLLPAMGEGARPIARLALLGDVISLNRRGERATEDLAVTAQANFQPSAPPTALVDALSKFSQYTLQDRAWQKAAAGDIGSATRLLSTRGTRLLSSGQAELAKMTIAEAKRLERTHVMSEEAKKRIKYGTRALMLPAPSGPSTGNIRS